MQTERIAPPPSHEKQQKLSNGSSGGGAGSKFADVQRRWNNGEVSNGNNSGEYSDVNAAVASDRQTPTPSPFVPSGSTPVKSLTGRFDKENLLADFESCADVTALRQLVAEQMREIETLKSQVRSRNERTGSMIKPPLRKSLKEDIICFSSPTGTVEYGSWRRR